MLKTAEEISTDSDLDYEVSASELDEEVTWIAWFCHLKGYGFFVEVDEDYIRDDFNLTGLSAQVPYYGHALNMILDVDDQDNQLPEDQQPLVAAAAQELYGLIHARFILTSRGMVAMLDKYSTCVFGTCPLAQCESLSQAVLPIGMSDLPSQSAAKVYCPCCGEVYFPRSPLECFDGAYFGTSFAHLFFLTYQNLVPQTLPAPCVPRFYGFEVRRRAKERLRRQREKALGEGAEGAAAAARRSCSRASEGPWAHTQPAPARGTLGARGPAQSAFERMLEAEAGLFP